MKRAILTSRSLGGFIQGGADVTTWEPLCNMRESPVLTPRESESHQPHHFRPHPHHAPKPVSPLAPISGDAGKKKGEIIVLSVLLVMARRGKHRRILDYEWNDFFWELRDALLAIRS